MERPGPARRSQSGARTPLITEATGKASVDVLVAKIRADGIGEAQSCLAHRTGIKAVYALASFVLGTEQDPLYAGPSVPAAGQVHANRRAT